MTPKLSFPAGLLLVLTALFMVAPGVPGSANAALETVTPLVPVTEARLGDATASSICNSVTLWEIGTFQGDEDAVVGRAEFQSGTDFFSVYDYNLDTNPDDEILAPNMPGILCDEPYSASIWAAARINIHFNLDQSYSNVTLSFSRYGSENNDVLLDGNWITTTFGPGENINEIHQIPLGTLTAGTHTVSLQYAGGGIDDCSSMDAVGLRGSLPTAIPTVWQIGGYDGPTYPLDGAHEFEAGQAYFAVYPYNVDTNPDDEINAPNVPAALGTAADADEPFWMAGEIDIAFELDNPIGNAVLAFSRYGSEINDILLDGSLVAQTLGVAEEANELFFIDLGSLAADAHTLTLKYAGGGISTGNYIDAIGLCETEPAEPRPWTMMYYQAGDSTTANGGDFGDVMLLQTAHLKDGSNNTNLNVVVFRDTLSAGAVYEAYVDGAQVKNISKGELNTSWPETLSDFVVWAKSNYPANHYALVMFGHSHGLTGSMQDLTNDPQSEGHFLDPRGFRTALLESGPVDVVYMEACLVANLEYAYQARGQTLYYVASEAQVIGPAYHTYLGEISSLTSAEELAKKMLDKYELRFEDSESLERTMSVGDMSKIDLVVQRTRELAAETRSHCGFDPLADDIWNIISGDDVQRFPDNDENVLADLYHFAQLIDGLGDADLSTAATSLMAAIDDYVVWQDDWDGDHGDDDDWDFSNAHGLSIILPTEPLCYYTADWFDFAGGVYWALCPLASPSPGDVLLAEENEWGQMLSDFIEEFSPDAVPQYEPPPLVPVDVSPLERLFLPLILRMS